MDRHSTLVAWAKILLPLAALALLSTLFLIARAPSIDDAQIPYADLDALARDQQVSAPSFSGVADDGSIIAITAERALPEDGGAGRLRIDRIDGTVDAPGGRQLAFSAASGLLDQGARAAEVAGPVEIVTTGGYRITAAGLRADLDGGRLEAAGPLEAEAPYGSLTAGRMVAETPEGGGPRLVFQDGVRLVYRRQTDEGAPE